jgi:hypothetical protein
MNLRKKGLLFIALGFLIASGSFSLDSILGRNDTTLTATPLEISTARQTHILTGDATGGGHRAGTNKPCKSEFPPEWSDDKIIVTIGKIAANDNLFWKEQDNGYYVAEQSVDGVRVRVVMDKQRAHVITGYPTNLPRNPCRTPANDN